MSRKDRVRIDTEAVADFEQRSRAAAVEALREIDPDITDEEIARRLAKAGPVLIGVRGRRLSRQNIPPVERRTVSTDAEGIDRMNRWLPGAAIHGGRTDERQTRLGEYRRGILAMADDQYQQPQITARAVLRRIHRTGSESQLWSDVSTVGGWRRFRANVLSGR